MEKIKIKSIEEALKIYKSKGLSTMPTALPYGESGDVSDTSLKVIEGANIIANIEITINGVSYWVPKFLLDLPIKFPSEVGQMVIKSWGYKDYFFDVEVDIAWNNKFLTYVERSKHGLPKFKVILEPIKE